MHKRLSWGAALSMMIIVIAVTVCVTMLVAMRRFNAQVNELSYRQSMYSYIADVDSTVRQNYYGTIDETELRHAMASGEVAGLGDPYAHFLSTEEYSALQELLSGQSTGFGLEVTSNETGLVVISAVQKGSTAYSAGLQKGDVVTALDKEALGKDPLTTVQEALKTSQNLILTVNRDGKETAFELSAAAFTRVSVDSTLVGATGYIRVKSITDATPDQLKAAYSALKEQGAATLVLDLRGNEIGSPEAAKKILSFLLPYGLYGYYQNNSGLAELTSDASSQLDLPTAVLVNGKTAGEAELIAAALKQAGVATLVGDKTAGRAKAQNCFAMASDNSAVRITVGEFLLLNKENWEGHGLTPDVTATLTAGQESMLDLLDLANDSQFAAAVNALTNGNTAEPTEPTTPPTDAPTTPPTTEDTTTPENTDDTTAQEATDTTSAAE